MMVVSVREESVMSTKRYSQEFKREAVALYRSDPGHTYAQIARELGCSAESLRAWVRQVEVDAGERDGQSSAEREEARRLKRENRRLRMERDILKKAAAYFASEEIPR